MTKQDDFKLLLNFVHVSIVWADNNRTADEITENLRNLNKWQEDLKYRLCEDKLTEEDVEFYNERMETIRKTLTNELEKMNKVLWKYTGNLSLIGNQLCKCSTMVGALVFHAIDASSILVICSKWFLSSWLVEHETFNFGVDGRRRQGPQINWILYEII